MKAGSFYRYTRCPNGPVYKCIFTDPRILVLMDVTRRVGKTYELPAGVAKKWQEMRQVVSYQPKGH